MWTPAARIKHGLFEAPWPTVEEAARSRLYSPIRLGKGGALEVESRTWVPAMVPWRASDDGFVTDDVIAWYARFAAGRPGVIVVEATGIRDVPSGPLLRIGHDRFLPGLTRLVEAVRTASGGRTRLFLQILDFLAIKRRPEPARYFERFLVLTDRHRAAFPEARTDEELRRALAHVHATDEARLADILDERELEALRMGYRERVTDVDLPHIRALPQVLPGLFADASARAFAAGFDGVELHFAHAYTMASFLSARNDRADGYGGSRAARVRLPLEVVAACRERVGSSRILGCRFLADEIFPGGSTVEDAAYYGVELARAGLDFLSLSRGGKFEDAGQPKVGHAAYPYTGPSGYECMPTVYSDEAGPFGRNVEPATRVRQAVRAAGFATPIVVAGGIAHFAQAEALLAADQADFVGAARQSLADPDWFEKVRLGRGDEVRRCHFTNYCEALDQQHKQVTCKLWDRVRLDEPGVRLDPAGRRRLTAPRWERPDDRSDT